MRKELQNKAKKLAFGVGVAALLTIPVATMVSTSAGAADTTCYTGCSAPTTSVPVTTDGGGSAALTSVQATTTTPGGLAFTGADLGELIGISAGALGAGTLLVTVSRRRRRTA